MQEIIDEEDEELNKLRKEWGEEVYMAVVTTLKELDEYNPSGRYVIFELWNFRNQLSITRFLIKLSSCRNDKMTLKSPKIKWMCKYSKQAMEWEFYLLQAQMKHMPC